MNLRKITNQRIILLPAFIVLLTVVGCSTRSTHPPILVIANHTDFGTYTGEILKTEGFNEFEIDSINSLKITASYLDKFDLVILAEQKLDLERGKMISGYVKKGGNLIAFRPDPSMADLFGILPATAVVNEGYIAIDTTTEFGTGITGRAVRFHGSAEKWMLGGGKVIATLLQEKSDNGGFPAVVINKYGKGNTVAFSYNLPESIVYTRQGNPLFAGIEKDSIPGLRGMDLFTDGWLDNTNSTINQADEQMMFLSRCIMKIIPEDKPIPRFWYFPDSLKCLVTLTNDGEYKSESDFEPQFRDVDSMGAKMSIYIIGVDKVSRAWVDKWTARGFEISGHPDDTREAGNPVWNNMDSVIAARKKEIFENYGLPMRTNVNHWFVWCGTGQNGEQDFGAEARLEEKNGIEMDINYAHYDIKSNQGANYLGPPGTNQGNYTGSGLVMKFADVKGQIINVYQHFNAVYDQQYNESHDPEGFFNCFKGLMDRSIQNGVYSFISVKSHNDEYYFSKTPLMKMLEYSNSNGIPVWTALKLLDFIKMRDEATFTEVKHTDNMLLFNIKSSLKHPNGLSVMIPVNKGAKKISKITKDETDTPFTIKTIRGSDYAFLTVDPGKNYTMRAKYGR